MKTMMSESMKKEFGRAMRGIALVGVIAGACPPGAWAQQAEAPGALERRVDAAVGERRVEGRDGRHRSTERRSTGAT